MAPYTHSNNTLVSSGKAIPLTQYNRLTRPSLETSIFTPASPRTARAEILNAKLIVDIGTGTGRWVVEMAARYPGAKILGIDIAPIQSKLVPQNVRFEVADVEEPWTIVPDSVDFIHVRSLAGMIRNWPALLAQAFDKLRPGGLLEVTDVRGRVLDFDGKFGEDEVTPHLSRLFQEMASKEGTIFDTASQIPGWLHDEGFEKVAQRTEILPLGAWPKDKKLRAREKLTTAMVLPWFREFTLLEYSTGARE